MAAVGIIPNIAVGRINELVRRVDGNDPANSAIVIVLFETGDTIANLRDYDNLSALLAGPAVESAFTNYARTILTDTGITGPTVDDTGNLQSWELADQTPLIASAGGASNEPVAMIGLFYDPDTTSGTDADLIPLHLTLDNAAADLLATTNGSDLDLNSPSPTWSSDDVSA